ncbi:dihydropteroate synthase [Candidatus Omnitrophota bacterium]
MDKHSMSLHALSTRSRKSIAQQMRDIDVYEAGIKIMSPKAVNLIAKLAGISSIAANILKQEMLSLSGEVAVSKGVITGKERRADCLIIGNIAQYNRLIEKLKTQPFGLDKIAVSLQELKTNYFLSSYKISAGDFTIHTNNRTLVMGIINATPDSFSGDGIYAHLHDTSKAVSRILQLVADGADIVDIGGQSTRPGAKPVSVKEEIERTIPVIKKAVKRIKKPISIDTFRPEVAKRALDAGASIVNNIMGVKNNKAIAKLLKQYKAAVVTMHIKGSPQTMQKNPRYGSLMTEIIASLCASIDFLKEHGVAKEQIIIDPGIGFGKTVQHNLEIIQRLRELKSLGRPILIGPSRKSFIGAILRRNPSQRLLGTAASIACAIHNGADIIRVHDVRDMKQVSKLTDTLTHYN